MTSPIRRLLGAGLRTARRMGLDIRPTATSDARLRGMTMGWRPLGDDALHGTIVEGAHDGVPIRFFVENDFDAVQHSHRQGRFYEQEELAIIASGWRMGRARGAFVDVGANVGNHALYALLVLGTERVVAFEPQAEALRLLRINALLNGCDEALTIHPLGLSDKAGRAEVATVHNNLGASRLSASAAGPVALARGDDLLAGQDIALVKIDTEGYELPVLRGLSATIAHSRPPLFVEVELENIAAFEQFCAENGYKVTERFQRYPTSVNYLAIAQERR